MSLARLLTCWLALIACTVPVWCEVDVDLEWRPAAQTVQVGSVASIGLYAVSSDPELNQAVSAVDIIFAWDPNELQLLEIDDTGGPGWIFSGFPADPFGINDANPPQDGDGMYTAFASLGNPVDATPAGILITTFRFKALERTDGAIVEILQVAGTPPKETAVFSGDTPNLNIVGQMGLVTVTAYCLDPTGDLDIDGDVDFDDLNILLASYESDNGGDLDCDGDTDFDDLNILLANYGS